MGVPKWLKPTLDLLLSIDFVIEGLSGIALYLAPSGRLARDFAWTFLGLGKETWEALHTYFGFAMVALVATHLIINWGPMVCMLRNVITWREKSSNPRTLLGLVLVVALFIGGGVFYALLY
ncbi:DUF4405 domain-containing protein [Thermococcus sp.]|uniref:DUF4405 domain-containing protein n=1 Tax=Thermococcus sp. TaxID=35749 RepID=UPI0026354F79|nr:DUF4405 domain-containing protein [Thermococcus sp.]